MSRILYVYIDESGTPGLSDSENFILGAFITETPISKEIIDKAIENLKNDNKGTKNDNRTILEGYFHASKDSPDAHSHLCTQIKKAISWPCEFFIEVINKNSISQEDSRDIGEEAKMHQHLLSIIGVHFTEGQFDTVDFCIAERQGSFKNHNKDRWADYFIEAMAYSAIQTPQIPIYLPEFKITVSNGTVPGIQVCDFLLWSAQRAAFRGDSTWVERSGLFMHSSYRINQNPLSGNEYYLNRAIPDEILFPLENIPKLTDLKKYWTQNGINNGMINIELHLRSLAEQTSCIKNDRLENRLFQLIPQLKQVRLHNDLIVEMAKLYLLLADQVPFYNNSDKNQIEQVFHNKKICSKTADYHHISWLQFCNHWNFVRQWIFENDSEVLFKS